jgi:hypothetical protein
VRQEFFGSSYSSILIFFSAVFILSGCSGLSAPTIVAEPASLSISELQTATFSVQAAGSAPLNFQWSKNGVEIPGATETTYSTPRATLSDSGATFTVTLTNPRGNITSNPATLKVGPGIDVATYHYDNSRTGQNLNEKTLTPSLVNQTTFGLLGSFAVDGKVQAQPLLVSNLKIPGLGPRNVLYVVTEHATVFAFDADANGATTSYLWKVSTPQAGETSGDDRGCGQVRKLFPAIARPRFSDRQGAFWGTDGHCRYVHRVGCE